MFHFVTYSNFELMEKNGFSFSQRIVENIRKILVAREMKQAAAAMCMDISPSQFSRILKGEVSVSLDQLSKFATGVGLREIDIITWPERYEKQNPGKIKDADPVEAVLQIRLQSDKKDQVLKLIFGENNIEILNR